MNGVRAYDVQNGTPSRAVSSPQSEAVEHSHEAQAETEARSAGERAAVAPSFDLSKVRVHADDAAAQRAESVGAAAFTIGRDIFFGAGRFRPEAVGGRRLIGHELAHVGQQAASGVVALQRAPKDEQAVKEKVTPSKPAAGSPFALPWAWGDFSLFQVDAAGIAVLVSKDARSEATLRTLAASIAKRIAADNKRIADPARRVTLCAIAPVTTRFALFNGRPMLLLDHLDANVETASHEMGHAVFDAISAAAAGSGKGAARARDIRSRVADVFARLEATKVPADSTKAVGILMVDPPQWSKAGASEHPWSDPDEFFASAKEAYQINRKGLAASIARATKADPAVAAPAKDLMSLLAAVYGKGVAPKSSLSEDRRAKADEALKRVREPTKVEDTLRSGLNQQLLWLLEPNERPGAASPTP